LILKLRRKYDGADLWLAHPHLSIESGQDDVKRVVETSPAMG